MASDSWSERPTHRAESRYNKNINQFNHKVSESVASQVRICPHCGASVIGNTTHCPRCDQLLESAAPAPLVKAAPPKEDLEDFVDTVQAMPAYQPPAPTPVPAVTPPVSMPAPVPSASPPVSMPPPVPAASPPLAAPNFETARTAPVQTNLIGATAAPPRSPSIEAPSRPQTAPAFPIPHAPYTPPPLREATKSLAPYSFPSNHFLEQRVAAYRQGGYEMVAYTPFQVTMALGKGLGFFWWLVAMLSGVGFLWYLVIMLTSGFSKDRVYLIVERDGTLYEDGAGAAHVRRHRAKVGRRWGFLGVVIFFIALLWFMAMIGVGVYGVENYRPELEASYPEVTLFASDEVPPDSSALDPERLQTAESGVLAFSVLFGLCLLCLLAGLTMTIVGYLHSTAYDVEVMPLPVYK